MKTIWHGTISFGLVSVPVGLAKAQDRQTVSFRQLHRGCGMRVTQPKTCPEHGALTMTDIVRGYEYDTEKYVEVPDGEFEVTRPDASKVIEVRGFVPLTDVDPVARDRTYYLTPAKEANARSGYALLAEAMEQRQRGALASFVLWGRENLCIVRAKDGRMHLDLLYYAEDVRSPSMIDDMMDGVSVSDEELALAVQLVQAQSIDFDHEAYRSEYRDRLRGMLTELSQGGTIKAPKAKAKQKPKDDGLLAALQASLAAADVEKPKKKSTTRRKATTKKGGA